MSGDFEAFLRTEMADRAAAAPAAEDPGLADLAITGAARLRRRRRAAAAAGGAAVIALGAFTFIGKPWTALLEDDQGGTMAADSATTTEVQNDLGMEFVVQDGSGYSVLTAEGDTVAIGDQPPVSAARLAGGYMVEDANSIVLTSPEGEQQGSLDKPSSESTVRPNSATDSIAVVTPDPEFAAETHLVYEGLNGGETESPREFTTDFAVTLEDWNASTAVFTADLAQTAWQTSEFYFEDQYDWGMTSVARAGFESAVYLDTTETGYVCVADLDPGVGMARPEEECGPVDDEEIRDQITASAGDEDANRLVDTAIDNWQGYSVLSGQIDLGENFDRFYNAQDLWSDPYGEWQLAGSPGDGTWILVSATDDGAEVAEFAPPAGAVLPVLDYRLEE